MLTIRTAALLIGIVAGSNVTCEAQDGPVVKVHAYEREVVGGIPVGPPGVGAPARQTKYFIYLETPPAAQFAVEGVWMGGKFHAVDTSVKPAPVRFESPVKLAKEDLAVPATKNTVTEIIVGDPLPDRTPDSRAAKMLAGNSAAVQLSSGGQSILVAVGKFEKGPPLYLR